MRSCYEPSGSRPAREIRCDCPAERPTLRVRGPDYIVPHLRSNQARYAPLDSSWGRPISPRRGALDLCIACALFACGLLILYALSILVVSLAFKVVKIDNMSHLFVSLFEAARWRPACFAARCRCCSRS